MGAALPSLHSPRTMPQTTQKPVPKATTVNTPQTTQRPTPKTVTVGS